MKCSCIQLYAKQQGHADVEKEVITCTQSLIWLLSLPTGGSLMSSQGSMATGGLLMLLRCRGIKVRVLGGIAPTDRDALLRLMPTAPALEAKVVTGHTSLTPPTTSIPTADPTCRLRHKSPQITKCGPPSTGRAQPTRPRSGMKYNRAARRMNSSTKADPTVPCLHLSARGSMPTTGSATVMYAHLHLPLINLSMMARRGHLGD